MSRKKIIAGNWKMNLSLSEAIRLAQDIRSREVDFATEVMIFPPFIYLTEIARIVQGSRIGVGAQNCAAEAKGAFTGEVSAAMLASAGIHHVLVGHSERRECFGETDEQLKKKLKQAMAQQLKVIFCCGEPLAIRENGEQKAYVLQQLRNSLFALSDEEMLHITLAYEPVWAIGTGKHASPEQAQEMHRFIREALTEQYGDSIARQTRILYGGSCKPDNARSLFACPDVDGGLIGGASLQVDDFIAIIHSV